MEDIPGKRPRKSLTGLFTELDIGHPTTDSTMPLSPVRRRNMSDRFKSTITSTYAPVKSTDYVAMTVRMDDVYRTYESGPSPEDLFEKARVWLTACQKNCDDMMANPEKQEALVDALHATMIEAVFGSNAIERAGAGWDITLDLCRKVFRGEDLGPVPIPERDAKYYDEIVGWMRSKEPELRQQSAEHILRSRNEVVQHAKAMQHIINVFAIQEQDMSEDLLKETHRILVTGVSIKTKHSNVPWEDYAGQYRTVPVSAGRTNFVVPAFIPKNMAQLVADLISDLQKAKETQSVDPVALAAKYAMDFVQIHPFLDGNGRMCRLILNAIMFRFTTTIVPLGEHGDGDRDEWIGVSARAANECTGHGELGTLVLKKWGPKLRRLKKKLAGKANNA